CQQHKTYPPTF
nr:immunoglobulin light chain junction region [Macaca mulatta]